MRTRTRCLAALIGLGVTVACRGPGGEGARTDTTGAPAVSDTTTSTAAASPATGRAVNYEVDPKNVAAALQYDSATKTVTYPLVAGLTSANNAWNFNGYHNGNMTITVPVGSRVVIPFSNLDGNVPHSFGIIGGSTSKLATAADQPLIFGASTRRYETGIRSVERDVVRFTASEAGEYLLACGVPGHAAGGMWIHFHVSARATRPEVTTR